MASRAFILTRLYITLFLIAGIVLGIGGLLGYQEYRNKSNVTTFDECVKADGSQQLLIYPGKCITRNGKQFTQPIDANIQSFVCPENGWVDCMPGPGPTKKECTKEALSWFEKNCPEFQGAAL